MGLADGCKDLKRGGETKFWFLGWDAEKKPLLLLSKGTIPKKEIEAAKKTAKTKADFGGVMVLADGQLRVYSDASIPTTFKNAAKDAIGGHIEKPKSIMLLDNASLKASKSEPKKVSKKAGAKGEAEGEEDTRLDLKSGCALLKKGKALKFWYIAQDENGEPKLLLDKRKVIKKETVAIKKKAKKKDNFFGTMTLVKGELRVYTDEEPAAQFEKKIKLIIAEYMQRPKKVVILTGEEYKSGPAQLGEGYKGEDKEFGWRSEMTPDDKAYGQVVRYLERPHHVAAFVEGLGLADEKQLRAFVEKNKGNAGAMKKVLAKRKTYVTNYLNRRDQQRATVDADDEGLLTRNFSEVPDTERDFIVDAATGELRTADGVERQKREDGTTSVRHHSTMAAGDEVIGAGTIATKKGRVTKISDQSGHYKPDAAKTLQVLKKLEKMGAKMVGDDLLDENNDPKDVAAGLKVRAKWLREYSKRLAEANTIRKANGEKSLKPNKGALEIQNEMQEAKVWFSNQSLDITLLGKKGAISEAEWEKVKGNEKKLLTLIKKKTGLGDDVVKSSHDLFSTSARAAVNLMIGQITSRTLKKEQFEQTGGNEDQIRAKDAMQEELLEKTKGRKKKIAETDRAEIDESNVDPRTKATARRKPNDEDDPYKTFEPDLGNFLEDEDDEQSPSLRDADDSDDDDAGSPYLEEDDGESSEDEGSGKSYFLTEEEKSNYAAGNAYGSGDSPYTVVGED